MRFVVLCHKTTKSIQLRSVSSKPREEVQRLRELFFIFLMAFGDETLQDLLSTLRIEFRVKSFEMADIARAVVEGLLDTMRLLKLSPLLKCMTRRDTMNSTCVSSIGSRSLGRRSFTRSCATVSRPDSQMTTRRDAINSTRVSSII